MPWNRVVRFTDPLECRVQAADVEIFPTKRGSFQLEITQIGMNRLWMQRFYLNAPHVNTLAVRRGRQAINFLTEATATTLQHCGVEILPGDIVVNDHDVVHQRSSANLRSAAMSLAVDELNSAAESIIGRGFPEKLRQRIIRPDSALMARLLKLHKMVGQLAHETPEILEEPEVRRALEEQLIHVMVRCLAGGIGIESTMGARRHDKIVGRFEEFLAEHPERPLYLTEICAGIGVAERTLRASCEEHLGMGPIRYLTLRRMHQVRKALLLADPSRSTVTRIVTDHGFWELGRFSVAYRALFGEAPSETMRRPPNHAVGYSDRRSLLTSAQASGSAF
jgi:AraC-like DNA-binding protein